MLTTGVLFLLQTLNMVELHRTWPAWILVIGIVKLLQSNASSAGHVGLAPAGRITPPPLRLLESRSLGSGNRPASSGGGAQWLAQRSQARSSLQSRPSAHPHRRSFAGPLVLIILGMVFLLGNLHMISWVRLGTFLLTTGRCC